jgi:histidinol-phosphate aminotransferase
MTRPPFTPVVEALPHMVPFVGPEAMERTRGRPFRARLGANESSFGPSPRAIEAMRAAVAENWKYSDPETYELRAAIAAFHGVPMASVMVGEGIDGLLGLTAMLFLSPGEVAVTTEGAYPTFNFHVQAHGGKLAACPMRDLHEDLSGLREAAIKTRAKLLYVSNPNSHMGTYWPAADLERFITDLPAGAMLLLDEAYCETAPAGTAPAIDAANAQVLRYRTFSKAYGLAGARIGYAIGSQDVIAAFDKVRNHYGINRVGQIGAKAALEDQDYLRLAAGAIERARNRIAEIARANGLAPLASAASFVAIDCGQDGAFAKRVLDNLIARDVFIRKPVVANLDRFIRVSCGVDADLDVLAEELPGALADARRGG